MTGFTFANAAFSGQGLSQVGEAPPQTSGGSSAFAQNSGLMLSAFGALTSAFGAFMDIRSQQRILDARESSALHNRTIGLENARIAELNTDLNLAEGRQQMVLIGLQQGSERGLRRARQGASGVVLGQGSAAEADASAEFVNRAERFNIESNLTRQAAAGRVRATNARSQAELQGAQAANFASTRDSISPGLALGTSLLSNAGTLSREWRFAQGAWR